MSVFFWLPPGCPGANRLLHVKSLCAFSCLNGLKNSLRGNKKLGNVNVLLVLKGLFGGSPKMTLQEKEKNNPQRLKITFKDSLGLLIPGCPDPNRGTSWTFPV